MEAGRRNETSLEPSQTRSFSMSSPTGAPAWPTPIVPPKLSYRPQLSAQEWDALRPMIKQLYIIEGKTFREVAKWLRDTHNFNPTKRQFDGRIVKWGLRKNRKHGQLPNKDEGHAESVIIARVEPAISDARRPQRWPSEETGEIIDLAARGSHRESQDNELVASPGWSETTGPSTQTRTYSIPLSPVSSRADVQSTSWQLSAKKSSLPSFRPMEPISPADSLEATSSTLPRRQDSTSSLESMESVLQENSALPEPQTLWDMANITGSPKLNGLFTALQIDEEIPLLPQTVTPPVSPKDYISKDEIAEIWKEADEEAENDRQVQAHATALARTPDRNPFSDSRGSGDYQQLDGYFRQWISLVEKMISPLGEISPFATSTRTGRAYSALKRFDPRKPISIQISDSETRLTKLEAYLPQDNPGVISAAEQLAKLHLEVGTSKRAEALFLRVALAKQRILGTEHPETVSVYLSIVAAMEHAGEHSEAEKLHKKLHARILEIFGPQSELGITSIALMGGVHYHNDRPREAEDHQRQSLQLALNTLGKHHPLIPEILADLGVNLYVNNKNDIGVAERLVREGFEVDCALHGGPENVPLHHFGGLAWILPLAGRKDESIQLHRMQVARSWKVEGMDHWATRFNLRRLSKALRFNNDLVTAEPKSKLALLESIQAVGVDHRQTIDCIEEVAMVLLAMGEWREAAVKYEQVYVSRVKTHGVDTAGTRISRDALRECYSMQGLYTEAHQMEERLYWLRHNLIIPKAEKEVRQWSRYDMDLEDDERESRASKRMRSRESMEADQAEIAEYKTGFIPPDASKLRAPAQDVESMEDPETEEEASIECVDEESSEDDDS